MIELNALVLANLIHEFEKEHKKNKMKSFEREDVYSWSNCKDANQFQRCKGYFGDSLEELRKQIEENHLLMLKGVFFNNSKCFCVYDDSRLYSFFVPLYKVKDVEEPKKWRAFRTFEEFILVLGTIGCHVRFRFKDDISNEFLALIVGFNYEAQTVTINNSIYSFKELFKKFEFYKNQEWQPFGVKE